MGPCWENCPLQKARKPIAKGMDFFGLAKYSFKSNFVRIKSYVKPLKPRTCDAVSHKFSLADFKTVGLCDIGSISLKSLISSVTRRHPAGLRQFRIHMLVFMLGLVGTISPRSTTQRSVVVLQHYFLR